MLFDSQDLTENKEIIHCPYCHGKDFIKRGKRKKKFETYQIYYCNKCQKRFTLTLTKHKTFPLRLILDALTFYNRLNTLEESANKVSDKYGIKVAAQNISNWLNDFKEYLPFLRMREFVEKKYNKKDIFMESKMFHGQIYAFRYHRAKTGLISEEDFKHYKFRPIQEFLELIIAECPHRIFKDSTKRASEYKDIFNLDQVKITPKDNMATKSALFVLQAVSNNKLRHEILQEFMLVNNSVTVATEIPVLLDKDESFTLPK